MVMKVFNWIFSVFCILCLPVFGFHVGSILMCILGIASLPVKPIKEKWELLPKYKVLRPIIVGILFVVFCCMIPTGKKYADSTAEISTESTTETEETETQEIIVEETETEMSTEKEKVILESKDVKVKQTKPSTEVTLSLAEIPEYSGKPYVEI